MSRTVLAVFSGTDVNQEVFREALARARQSGAELVLLDVRHRRQAERLGEFLTTQSWLGKGTVDSLRRSVKQQRDRAIGRALRALEAEAAEAGVQVRTLQVKGEFAASVRNAAAERGAAVVVVEDGAEAGELQGPFEVMRVEPKA